MQIQDLTLRLRKDNAHNINIKIFWFKVIWNTSMLNIYNTLSSTIYLPWQYWQEKFEKLNFPQPLSAWWESSSLELFRSNISIYYLSDILINKVLNFSQLSWYQPLNEGYNSVQLFTGKNLRIKGGEGLDCPLKKINCTGYILHPEKQTKAEFRSWFINVTNHLAPCAL